MPNIFSSIPPPIPHATRPKFNLWWRKQKLSTVTVDVGRQSWINAIYYPNWAVYCGETPASLNYACVSHVFYAFAHVDVEGKIFLSDEWADKQMPVDGTTGCLASLSCLKQQFSHLKLILSIGGGASSQNFAAVASTKHGRETFGQSARCLVDTYALDGIDIDWEHPSDHEQGRNFISLLAAIRCYLPDAKYLLTAALPAGQWALQNIDLRKANEYLDLVNLMAYDFTGSWTAKAGHHAQLHASKSDECCGASAVNYVISTGFPVSKLLLGIPVYGRSFLGASGPDQTYTGHAGDEGTFKYKDLPRQNCQETVNPHVVAASCYGGDGGFVTYDNPDTVRIKAKYCREKGLGGLFYWTGTADAPSGPRSLVSTGFHSLHGH
ncbi:Bgt-939 [Blumeria graminis f. sp. tritici]|uniref:chitinase n=2 Tax=Blumeria graminis f. sp. tritici TaxID=62690 RepID=A0A061HGC2_BLUGR|nr:Sporulation-specific chitinase [Blumeria graminis f. sp. tritici 96224]VCU40370.1 Bgt-939 [Blumeria graminis f. sp. tritici]